MVLSIILFAIVLVSVFLLVVLHNILLKEVMAQRKEIRILKEQLPPKT